MKERLEELFGEAIELPPSERTAFLERACDPELLPRLKAMLETHVRAERLAFFTPKTPSPGTEQPGQRIVPYLLREQLGEGGWGVVFLAEQEKPVRRRVALKVIKAGLDTRNVIARFEAEREALARMDHPNIAKVLDAGATEAGRPYFVMELVSGPRITEYCNQKKLRISDRLELFAKVCQAVQHAHQKGIIHRDLKPSNILVAEHDGMPVPKIIDFGIAKATQGRLTDHTAYTGGPHLMGTPAYMSPEQTVTPSPDVDTRSDIYSLGVILYELLVGKTPFDSKKLHESSWEEMCRTIREKDPLRPSALLATLPENERTAVALDRGSDAPQLAHRVSGDLDWIVMKCLAKERARRYETANSLAMDVRRHLAAEPVIARPPSTTYRLQRLVVRNKLAFAAVGAVAIALVAGLTAAIFGWRAAVRAQQEAETARVGEASQRQWAEQNLYAADMSLAAGHLKERNRGHALELLGRYRSGTGREDLRGWEWRYLWKQCLGEELFSLTGHNGRVFALAFSPDNKTLFSGGIDGVDGIVKLWDLNSMKAFRTHRLGEFVLDLAISPDGNTLMIAGANGVAICDGPSFAALRQLDGAKGPLALSPNGRMLVTGGSDGAIIWNPATFEKLHDSTSVIPARSKITFSPDGSLFAMNVQSGGGVEVKIWNAAALREKGFQQPPVSVLQRGDNRFPVNGLAFSKHAEILATARLESGGQPGVRFWDAKTGLSLSPPESSGEVLNMAFLPDDKTLLTFNLEQDFRLWDISARTNIAFLRPVPGHENEIWSVALSPDGRMVASGSKDGMIKIWNMEVFLKQPEVKDRIDAPNIAEIGFSQDGRTMSSISLDSALGVWDTEKLKLRASGDLPRRFRVAVISPQGTHLALGLTNGAVEVWRIVEPKSGPQLIPELLPPQPNVTEPFFRTNRQTLIPALPLMTWSGDGKKFAAFVDDLYVWDIAAGQIHSKLSLQKRPDCIALSPNGEILAAASGPDIQLCEVRTGRRLSTCEGHKETTLDLAFSPDGKVLASVNSDNTAALWDVPSGSLRSKLTSHSLAVCYLAFSPDGRTLVTHGVDKTLRFWHVQTGRELMVIEAPFAGGGPDFGGVRFSPDGALMAVGLPSPAQIRFFRAPSLAEIDAGEAHKAGKQ